MTYSNKAIQYLGVKEGTKRHHEIIDYYNNNIRPLPRGYRMKYTDSWCACFVSVILEQCKAIEPPLECSVKLMADNARKKHQTFKDLPQINDIIVYDWKNDGSLNHVGFIYDIQGDMLSVIEGNYSNMVKIRKISTTSSEIECYIRVKQYEETPGNMIDKMAIDVIRGKYGIGKTRKELLGVYYKDVQKRVNELMKKKEG